MRTPKISRELIELFAANIKALRLAQALSQESLASKAGLHRTYVGSLERAERNVSLANIARLAQALSVSPHELLTRGESDER